MLMSTLCPGIGKEGRLKEEEGTSNSEGPVMVVMLGMILIQYWFTGLKGHICRC